MARPRWLSRRLVAGAVLLVALSIGAAGWVALKRNRGPDVPTAEVTRGDFVEIVETRGDIRPYRSILVTAPFQAGELTILKLAANGSTVKQGDVVADLDAVTLRRTLQDKQSELRQAQAELDQMTEQAKIDAETDRTATLKAQYDVQRAKLDEADPETQARAEVERTKLLTADAEQRLREATAKQEADKASSTADLATRKRKIDKIQADIDQAQRGLSSLEVKAPADGTVSLLQNWRASSGMSAAPEFRTGDRIWAGAQIMELPDLSSVHLTSHIDESDRGQLKVGQAATVRVDAVPDRTYSGTIDDISVLARVDFSSGWPPAKNFDLTLSISDADPRLRPGMSAVARIAVGKIPDMLLIPSGAVFPSEGRLIVYKRVGSHFDEVPIEIVRRGREQIAVKGALAPGDHIALVVPAANKAQQGKQ
ncbi:MAG TPA: efflux RND transporter periplasmic adaptor subunit [Vicinamibacterales bacterium]|nr:efflux RND transporter periplasmic adaptor subunit [Vicinamibacterales bacterium]